MSKKTGLLICLVIFLSVIAYGLVQAGVVNFVDGINIQYAETIYKDQVPSKAEAENLLMPLSGSLTPSAHLEKNAGGCRIRLGNYSSDSQTNDYSQGMYFWQGYFWGAATAIASTNAANSCVCPTGTTRVLRRSQGNNQISSLDTTWWKEFRFVGTTFVFGWTTQCTQSYQNYPAGCMTGDPGCSCSYNYNNCLNRKGRNGCDGFVNFNYTEYLYNCVANSETLKQ